MCMYNRESVHVYIECIYIYIYIYSVCAYISMYIYICIHIYIHVYIYKCAYISMYNLMELASTTMEADTPQYLLLASWTPRIVGV